jgi:PAS domain S-box-containing protein
MKTIPTRLLLVEDEAIIALAEKRMLDAAGYSVEIARSGEAAIRAFEDGDAPRLVLMDIDLGPGLDGTETARIILGRWRVPIVFLTSHCSREMVEKVRGITRYGYIVKNSGEFIITSTIEMALELFEKEQALEGKNRLLERAEKAAKLGYWIVEPGASAITLSRGSREIVGIDSDTCSFEEFGRLVCPDTSERRSRAFKALIEAGEPYDMTYTLRRPDCGELVSIRSSARASNGTITGIIQDITEISELLWRARSTEERQAVTLRSIGDGVIATDREGRVAELNRTAETLTGWSSAEAMGKPIVEVFSIVNAITRKPVENPIQKVMESGYIVGLANHTILVSRDGIERHIADSAAPIRDEAGSMLGMVLVFRDVSEQYRAEEDLRRNAEMFEALFLDSHTAMLLVDPDDGSIHEANKAAESYYGWSAGELRSMNIAQINTLEPARIHEEMDLAVESSSKDFHSRHKLASGEIHDVLVSSGPIRLGGRTLLLSIVRDATDTRRREAEMSAARERAETLRRDANHRMKNNVQMISSLIQLQLSEISDSHVKDELSKLNSRIASMSLVYDQLYSAEEGEIVGAKGYLGSLLKSIASSYLPPSVRIQDSIADLDIQARLALSIGLIVGELVMNACKYAFPDGRSGLIEVRLEDRREGLRLLVRDDGIGMGASGARDARNGGIGLDLVDSLAKQEDGIPLTRTGPEGTSMEFLFPVSRP